MILPPDENRNGPASSAGPQSGNERFGLALPEDSQLQAATPWWKTTAVAIIHFPILADKAHHCAMAWAHPQHPKGRVDAAGDTLVNPNASLEQKEAALEVINNWRSSHSYPLQSLKMTLRTRALKTDRRAITAQRLKRLSSIAAKLDRNKNMKLSQMQDIGGCRAVVKGIRQIERVLKRYTISRAKNPTARVEFVKMFDYIQCPKVDGYRSVHLIYKYRSPSPRHKVWHGLRIEIQLRTKLQHAWATAVETVDAFTGQGLKTSGGSGTEKVEWGRLFALMGSFIACKEKKPMVPGTPNRSELIKELRQLSEQLQAEIKLRGWSYGMQLADERAKPGDEVFLLTLDTVQRTVGIRGFSDMRKAQDAYLLAEKELKPGQQSVLVSVDSLDAIRTAYPNYFADTGVFVGVLEEAVAENKEDEIVQQLQGPPEGTPQSAAQ
jgi:ppGpp synthetase/RelA/SpoT-type nucleotidyltranferase